MDLVVSSRNWSVLLSTLCWNAFSKGPLPCLPMSLIAILSDCCNSAKPEKPLQQCCLEGDYTAFAADLSLRFLGSSDLWPAASMHF